MNSRQKGKRGELDAAAFLSEQGFPARRGQQFAGSPDTPDVLCPLLKHVHFEIKRTQRTDLYGWIKQAVTDAGEKMPVVLHRKNNAEWLAIIRAPDLLALLRDTNSLRVERKQEQREANQTRPSTSEGTEP